MKRSLLVLMLTPAFAFATGQKPADPPKTIKSNVSLNLPKASANAGAKASAKANAAATAKNETNVNATGGDASASSTTDLYNNIVSQHYTNVYDSANVAMVLPCQIGGSTRGMGVQYMDPMCRMIYLAEARRAEAQDLEARAIASLAAADRLADKYTDLLYAYYHQYKLPADVAATPQDVRDAKLKFESEIARFDRLMTEADNAYADAAELTHGAIMRGKRLAVSGEIGAHILQGLYPFAGGKQLANDAGL